MIGEITSGTIEKWNKGWNLFFSSFLNISYQEVIFTDIRMRMFFKSFPVLVIFSQILCRTTKPCKTKRRLIFPFSLPETRCSIPPTKVTNQPTNQPVHCARYYTGITNCSHGWRETVESSRRRCRKRGSGSQVDGCDKQSSVWIKVFLLLFFFLFSPFPLPDCSRTDCRGCAHQER